MIISDLKSKVLKFVLKFFLFQTVQFYKQILYTGFVPYEFFFKQIFTLPSLCSWGYTRRVVCGLHCHYLRAKLYMNGVSCVAF